MFKRTSDEFDLSYPSEMEGLIEFDEPWFKYDRHGDVSRIYIGVLHTELSLYKEISGLNITALQHKLDELLAVWQQKYEVHIVREELEDQQQRALEESLDGSRMIEEAQGILLESLDLVHVLDWDNLKDKSTFDHNEPDIQFPKQQPVPTYSPPVIHFLDYIFMSKKNIQIRSDYERQYAKEKDVISKQNEAARLKFEDDNKKRDEKIKKEKDRFNRQKKANNNKLDEQRKEWLSGSKDAIVTHAELVLETSEYPDWISVSYDIDYDSENKLLKIQYFLPPPRVAEMTKSVRFVKTSGEFKRTVLSGAEQKRLYEDICYQITLRTVHELFSADTPKYITSIAFNGVVEDIDLATGHEKTSLILSALFERGEFEKIRLESVNPKKCFKSFGGVSAASLIDLAPVPPVVEFELNDPRFINHSEGSLQNAEATNIAAMNWQDFEYFIRELFEKEFSTRGGKVKVTQASKDGGVDAVAFDPDPISGGKIVIQAKRYTNTVDVSAVRDLYGTVVNEGATKGILVSTADFGPDAHKFASSKPISLLNGQHLLHLLQKHGINAKIDIKEAKKTLGLK